MYGHPIIRFHRSSPPLTFIVPNDLALPQTHSAEDKIEFRLPRSRWSEFLIDSGCRLRSIEESDDFYGGRPTDSSARSPRSRRTSEITRADAEYRPGRSAGTSLGSRFGDVKYLAELYCANSMPSIYSRS